MCTNTYSYMSLSIHLSIHPSTHLPIYLPIHLSLCTHAHVHARIHACFPVRPPSSVMVGVVGVTGGPPRVSASAEGGGVLRRHGARWQRGRACGGAGGDGSGTLYCPLYSSEAEGAEVHIGRNDGFCRCKEPTLKSLFFGSIPFFFEGGFGFRGSVRQREHPHIAVSGSLFGLPEKVFHSMRRTLRCATVSTRPIRGVHGGGAETL